MIASLRIVAAVSLALTLSCAEGVSAQQATDLLRQFRDETQFFRQFEIARRIAASGDRAALPSLEPWLSHEDRHVRGNAAFVFVKFADPRGLDTIRGILTDRASRPLGQGIATGVQNPQTPDRWMKRQIEADRYYAVHLLGESRNARAVPILVPLLDDSELDYKAAWALGELGSPLAIAPLIAALSNPDAHVRVSAIQALEKLKAKEAIPHLQGLLSDGAFTRTGRPVSVGETARAALETLR